MATMFLATVMGWYMVTFGCLLLFRDQHVKSVITDVIAQRGVFFLLGIITFLLGLLMVASHNVWVMGWEVSVTVVSWLVLIIGLMRLFLPIEATMSMSFLHHPMRMKAVGIVLIIFGGYLLFHVYHFQHLIR